LFDEIEKAHPEVFNIFLQVLDDGRLTDGQGRTVDFRNTVIIMTSNVGSQYILEWSDELAMRESVLSALRQHFRPEFLNRVDETIIFHRLEKTQLREIAEIQMGAVRQLLSKRNVSIALTDAALDVLIDVGYDPAYGARPLKRVIQKQIVDPLALKLIQAEVRAGDHVVVDAENGELTFSVLDVGEPEEVEYV
jgi:ATP-dependent Clp protease ATP-binding subunit ClpB